MSKYLAVSRARGSGLVGKRRTAAQWSADDPILRQGEVAVSSDTRELKIGDGIRPWSELESYQYENQVNESVADQALNAADTYLTGSALAVPKYGLQARASMRWRLWGTKTAAGIVAPIINIRIGVAGAIADTARLSLVLPDQTGAVDSAYLEVTAILRNVGAAAVLSGAARLNHNLENTGFSIRPAPVITGVSAAFSTAVDDLIIGLSINPGAAGVWTVQGVLSELIDT